MKKPKIALAALLVIGVMGACKKEEVAVQPSIDGFWRGKYASSSTQYPTFHISALLKTDGTCRFYYDNFDTTAANKAIGTYAVKDTIVNNIAMLKITSTHTSNNGGVIFTLNGVVQKNFAFQEGDMTIVSGGFPSNSKYFLAKQ